MEAQSREIPPSEERLQAYLDQVLLRIFNSSPGLSSYIESSRVDAPGGAIEISFFKVPEEIFHGIRQAFAVPEIEVLRYTKQKQPCVGFRCKPTREELSALAVDDGDEVADALHSNPDGIEDAVEGDKDADNLLKAPGSYPNGEAG